MIARGSWSSLGDKLIEAVRNNKVGEIQSLLSDSETNPDAQDEVR